MPQKKIWALLDERQGNTSQTLGVAEALGVPFETRDIRFNGLVKLPNPLLTWNRLGVSEGTRSALTPPWPDVVISTARRLGLVASYIKSQNPNCFLAQIQWPGFPSGQFDLIATPLHDGISAGGNVITTLGAPHRVTPQALVSAAAEWKAELAHLPSPRIAVLVGGGSRGREFGKEQGENLARLASALALSVKGSLMVTTSRRTGDAATEAMAKNLSAPHTLFAWQDGSAQKNPFYGFLGLADLVIATGDSISMCSEACATGKPVFIFANDSFVSHKHQKFVDELFARGFAKPLRENDYSPIASPQQLSEAATIAREIHIRAFGAKA